jgi:hypothetical protein
MLNFAPMSSTASTNKKGLQSELCIHRHWNFFGVIYDWYRLGGMMG